ncbi:hypothetical protein BH10ACI4_BH10ACI4_00870 [soil metagenome]
MNRRKFLAYAGALPVAAHPVASLAANGAVPATDATASPTALTSEPLMARYQLCMDRVMHGSGPAYTTEFLLADVYGAPGRRFTNFSGDVSGRWIGAVSAASATYRQHFPMLDEVVHKTLSLQHPEGYFGKTFRFDHPTDDDLALLWGNGRLLIGLMEYYALTGDAATLGAAKRLGDFLVRLGPKFNTKQMADEFGAAHFAMSYICWTQQTEGLAALYAATRDIRYRDLCSAIAERMERRPADHVHGYLCSLRGTLDLYTATGEKAHLKRVEEAWLDVVHSGDVLITYGVPEAWSPNKKRTEGCAECDWLRLNLALWRATGKEVYLEMAEHVLFNEFSMNQFSTGDFGHAILNEAGTPGIVSVRAWWCCTFHGLRTFPDIHRNVFRTDGTKLFYDLPIDGAIKADNLSARATSTLATDGKVRLHISKVLPSHSLTIRKPSWAKSLEISHNGKKIEGLDVGNLQTGDAVTVEYIMTLDKSPMGASKGHTQLTAFSFGPWLLGVPSDRNPGYFNELQASNTFISGSVKSASGKPTSIFDVPIAAQTVAYLPAEFPVQPSRVGLHAVAIQTASLPTQWQTVFDLRDVV